MRIAAIVATIALPAALLVGAAAEKAKCPVSGKDANKEISLSVNGKAVYFCCNNCPKNYAKQRGIDLAKAGACPLSGNPGKAEQLVIQETAELLHFCCPNCPTGYIKKNKLAAKDKGPGKCPVSGGKAKDNPGTSLYVNGEKLYFCCGNCPKKFAKKHGVDLDGEVGNCPVSNNPGKKENAMIRLSHEAVNFCCGNCKKKYVGKNFKDGIFVGVKEKKAKGKKEEAKAKGKDKAEAKTKKVKL